MKWLLILIGLACVCRVYAQNTAVSKKLIVINEDGVYRTQSSYTPLLDIVSSSVKFIDVDGNNIIDANEECGLQFQVENSGKGDGKDCRIKIVATGSIKGLNFSDIDLPDIPAGESYEVWLPIEGQMNTEDGQVDFLISVEEPNGLDSDPLAVSVKTHGFDSPLIQITDYSVRCEQGTTIIKKRVPFDLQVLVQNIKSGVANDVGISIELPENVILMEGNKSTHLGSLVGGGSASVTYSLIVNNDYVESIIPVTIKLSESYGKYAKDKTIDLQLNQTFATNKINIESRIHNDDIAIAKLGNKNIQSDVDIKIPKTDMINANTFVVIIANENYQTEAPVPYAYNDGFVFAAYCRETLGIPEQNIHFKQDATLNNIKAEIGWLSKVMQVYNGGVKAILYYAGHGIPDEKEKTAYLLPIDGYGADVTTGYALADLYSELGNIPSQSVMIFLDACFSGTKRDGDMLASARGVGIKVRNGIPKGNMVVFTAAQGDETAYPYEKQGHGLFTYYLLKKLQETKGDVTLGEFCDFVRTQVERQSIVVNGKLQTPTLIPSTMVGEDWKDWTLK